MTETPEEFRQRVAQVDSKFHEDVEKRAGPFRALAFEYEKLAVVTQTRVFRPSPILMAARWWQSQPRWRFSGQMW
jgi:hypothetical protein